MTIQRGNQRRYLAFSERLRRHLAPPITLKFLTYPTTFQCRGKKIVKLNTFFSKLYNNFGRKGDIYLPFLILNNFLPHLLKQIGNSIPFLHQNYGFFCSQETQI